MSQFSGQFIKCVYFPKPSSKLAIPLFLSPVHAGFPSPASDYIEATLDLNDLVIKHPAATFFLKVEGDSMTGAGIFSGDIVVADYSLTAKSGDVVIACLDGECTIKRLKYRQGHAYLVAEHPDYPPIPITPETQFEVWGVVTHAIHTFQGLKL